MADEIAELLERVEGESLDDTQRSRIWAAVSVVQRSIDEQGGTPMATIETQEERVVRGRRPSRLLAAVAAAVLLAGAVALLRGGASDSAVVATADSTSTLPAETTLPDAPTTTVETVTSLPAGPGPLETMLEVYFDEGAEAALATGALSPEILGRTATVGLTWAEWFVFFDGADTDVTLECGYDVGDLNGELCVVDATSVFSEVLDRRERYGLLATPDADGEVVILSLRGTTESFVYGSYLTWIETERPELAADACTEQGWRCVHPDEALREWAESEAFTDKVGPLGFPDE